MLSSQASGQWQGAVVVPLDSLSKVLECPNKDIW